METIDKSVIRPGDMLLHRGSGEISKLIAWTGDCPFSHAAWVYDDMQIAESATVGVRRMSLAERIVDNTDFTRIDVYRRNPTAVGGLTAEQIAAMRAVADAYLGTPYPVNELVMLGITSALRNKIPADNMLRLLLREVLDHLIDRDPKHEVCSELVYRSFAEARLTPSLAPEIVVPAAVDTPFPPIDWAKLIEEYKVDKARAETNHNLSPQALPSPSFGRNEVVTTAELQDKHAQVRDMLGAPQAPVVDPEPNPRTILPADLVNSPDITRLGTVMSAG